MIQEQPKSTPVFAIDPNQVGPMGGKKQWTQSTLGCFDSPKICCRGLLCPMGLFKENVTKLGGDSCTWCLWKSCFQCPLGIALRSMAREKFNIEGNYKDDVILGVVFDPCINCQVAREIEAAGL